MEARFSEKNQTANFAGNYVQRAVNHGASKNKQLIDNYLSENYQRIDITNDKFSRSKNVNLSKIDNYRYENIILVSLLNNKSILELQITRDIKKKTPNSALTMIISTVLTKRSQINPTLSPRSSRVVRYLLQKSSKYK